LFGKDIIDGQYVVKDVNKYLTKIANHIAKVPPGQVSEVLKRVYELEFGIDTRKLKHSDERVAVFEQKPIMDRMSGVGYEYLMHEYLERDILKYTGEKFEEFYSKPRWYTRAMIDMILKLEATQKRNAPKFPEEK
jgi:hypothetical protein